MNEYLGLWERVYWSNDEGTKQNVASLLRDGQQRMRSVCSYRAMNRPFFTLSTFIRGGRARNYYFLTCGGLYLP